MMSTNLILNAVNHRLEFWREQQQAAFRGDDQVRAAIVRPDHRRVCPAHRRGRGPRAPRTGDRTVHQGTDGLRVGVARLRTCASKITRTPERSHRASPARPPMLPQAHHHSDAKKANKLAAMAGRCGRGMSDRSKLLLLPLMESVRTKTGVRQGRVKGPSRLVA